MEILIRKRCICKNGCKSCKQSGYLFFWQPVKILSGGNMEIKPELATPANQEFDLSGVPKN